MITNNFGNSLLEVRQARKLTQEELAIKLGVTSQAVSRWERGVGLPDADLLCEMGRVLEVSIDSLLGIDNNKLSESGDDKEKERLLKDILAEPVVLKVGAGFIDILTHEQNEGFKQVQEIRSQMALELGYLLPVVRIMDSNQCDHNEYQIIIFDKIMLQNHVENLSDFDIKQLYTDLKNISTDNYSLIFNRQIVKVLIKNLGNTYPALVEGIIPEKISYKTIQAVLTVIISHKKPIRNLVKIVELIEDRYLQGYDVQTMAAEIMKMLS